jgi:hypothetical protein
MKTSSLFFVSAAEYSIGGILNNNPIHAFDEPQGVINKGMLGLRLEEPQDEDLEKDKIKNLSNYISALVQTIMSPSEIGQIRTKQEEMQTIKLLTKSSKKEEKEGKKWELSTLNFTPERKDLQASMVKSAITVRKYFKKSGIGKLIEDYLDEDSKKKYP